MSLREMLWPTRWKITLALLIGAVSVFLIYLTNTYYQDALFGLDLYLRVLSVSMSFAIVTAIYYPLSCGVVFLFRSFRGKPTKKPLKKGEKPEKSPRRREVVMAIMLILIFNPLTFSLLYAAGSYVNINVLSYPCGVQVFGFSADSPAELVGMGTGEVIIQVDGQAIDGTESLSRVLAGKSPGEFVRVKTDVSEYDIQLAENPDTQRAIMGVIIQSAYCRRW